MRLAEGQQKERFLNADIVNCCSCQMDVESDPQQNIFDQDSNKLPHVDPDILLLLHSYIKYYYSYIGLASVLTC